MGIVSKKSYRVDDEASFMYDAFASLKFGDLIIAKRYTTEEQKQKIETGHEVGPFIVVGRSNEGNLLCFKSSSAFPRDFIGRISIFPLKISNTNLINVVNKDTYVRTNKVFEINRERFLKKGCSLDTFFIKKLKKRIALNREMGIIQKDEQVKKYNIPIEAGDIIEKSNSWYLILYFNENKKAVCLPLLRYKTEETINIGGRDYNVDFNEIVILNSIKKAKRIGFVDSDMQIPSLLGKIEKYLKYWEEFYTIKRGSLVEYDGLLYYIYGEEGNTWLAYQVWCDNNSQFEKIVINQKYYYSDFKTNVRLEKEGTVCEALALANDKEIDYNKKVKKCYLEKEHKKGTVKALLPNAFVQVGTYVKRFFSGEEYIVVWRNSEIVVVVDENDIYTKKYNFRILNVDEISHARKVGQEKMREILEDTKDIIGEFLKENLTNEETDNMSLKKMGD